MMMMIFYLDSALKLISNQEFSISNFKIIENEIYWNSIIICFLKKYDLL